MPTRSINPFIMRRPVPASKFIGRREQVNTILSQLDNPESLGSSAISRTPPEFEWIINNIDPQRPTLLHALRSLINRPVSERGLALITSSEEPLTVLCKDIKFLGSPFPNILVPVHLRSFSTNVNPIATPVASSFSASILTRCVLSYVDSAPWLSPCRRI